MEPGDIITADDGRQFKIGELVAVQGWPGCTSMRCTRRGWTPDDPGECFGYHCPRCGEPTSMYGHSECPEAA